MQQDLAVIGVSDDISAFRTELRKHAGDQYLNLLQLNVWRPLLDILLDWMTIAAAVALVLAFGWWLAPVAVVVVANRQRALGNILHDAGHRNLHRSRQINDTLAAALIAPLLFADLATYRDLHLRHHQQLGSSTDPDKLTRPLARSWLQHYRCHLLSAPHWCSSVFGHLASPGIGRRRKLYITAWWMLACLIIATLAGAHCLATFLALWMLARATAFHAITTFREMCDHYGLAEGGVISFTRDVLKNTRDVLKNSAWYSLVQPGASAQQRLPPHPSPAACGALLQTAAGAGAVCHDANVPGAMPRVRFLCVWTDARGASLVL